MFCSVQSMGLSGIESYPVTVEVDCRRGLPRFEIVGLPDTAVKDSRERVHSAIGNLGYQFPAGALVVNLAPADTKKSGPLYALPILLGILAAGCGLLLPAVFAPFPAMLLEVCSGCDYAARTGLWASGLCCAALSVQGASVLLQVRTLCPPEVSLRSLLWGRLLHLPLSLALFYLGLPQSAVESFNTLCARVVPMQRVPTDCALLVFAVCCITACEACRLTEKKAQNAVPANKNCSAACKPPQNVVT